jgi:CBS-domain-containing membrane protein
VRYYYMDAAQQRLNRIRRRFVSLWKNYLYQSFMAAVVLFLVLWLLNMQHVVVIASIGSTAFIIFAMPRSFTAAPRRVIGGHIIGFSCGSLFALIPQPTFLTSILVYSLAVGTALCLMVALDAEHPPAGGTALGVVISGFSLSVMIAVLTSSVALSVAHRFLKRYLQDLT